MIVQLGNFFSFNRKNLCVRPLASQSLCDMQYFPLSFPGTEGKGNIFFLASLSQFHIFKAYTWINQQQCGHVIN